jgi:hypothetical protein
MLRDAEGPEISPATGHSARRLNPVYGLALLIALQLWLVVDHVPWRDELQAYLLVRDSHGLAGLFANLHYEGHPGLWYLCLDMAEAVVRAPWALKAVQIAIALGTTAIVWRRGPFPAWLKLLILAGYYPLFEYGVIARSYGLGALLAFAWLALRRGVWGWVILALMANVAVHFALLSAALVVAGLWIERRWSWPGAAVWAAGCLAAIATIAPAHDVTTGMSAMAEPLTLRLLDALRRQSATLYPALVGVWPYHWQMLLSPQEAPAPGAVAGIAAAVLAPLAVWREPRARLLPVGLFIALTAMSALLYPTYLRHVGVLALLLIALEWMRAETTKAPASPIFVGWMGVSALCGLWAAGCSLWIPFTYGRQETRWIAAHHLQNAAWAAYPGYAGSDISAYFDRPTYNLQKGCLNSFIRWDAHAYDDVDDDELVERIADPGPFAYLASDQDLIALGAPLRLIAHFGAGEGDNGVNLYAVDHPQQGVATACPSG